VQLVYISLNFLVNKTECYFSFIFLSEAFLYSGFLLVSPLPPPYHTLHLLFFPYCAMPCSNAPTLALPSSPRHNVKHLPQCLSDHRATKLVTCCYQGLRDLTLPTSTVTTPPPCTHEQPTFWLGFIPARRRRRRQCRCRHRRRCCRRRHYLHLPCAPFLPWRRTSYALQHHVCVINPNGLVGLLAAPLHIQACTPSLFWSPKYPWAQLGSA